MSENADDNKQAQTNEEELATRQVQIQSKRFYIDVKENKRGRFIKLAEVGVGGRKSRIIMSLSCAAEFRNHLHEFSEYNSNLGASHGNEANNKDNDGLLKSEVMNKDRKRYYLDLKENQRGRFLRVSMVLPRAPRAQIAIPAQGLIEFRDRLTELLNQYGETDEQSKEQELNLPESKYLKAENKAFYFDCGSNQRGVFLRISEVRQYRYRTAITVPEKYWDQFCKNIKEFIDKVETERGSSNATNNDNNNKQPTQSGGDKAGQAAQHKGEGDKSTTATPAATTS